MTNRILKIKLDNYDTEQTSNIYWIVDKLNQVIEVVNNIQLQLDRQDNKTIY